MIQHIKVWPFPGSQPVELTNLGRVNVLVGRNCSGKTAILQAIAARSGVDYSKCALGVTLTPELATVVEERMAASLKPLGLPPAFLPPIESGVKSLLAERIRSDRLIVWEDEVRELQNDVCRAASNHGFGWSPFPANVKAGEWIWDILVSTQAARLVSLFVAPIRFASSEPSQITPNASVGPDGRNIGTALLLMATDAPSSPEAERFTRIGHFFEQVTGWKFRTKVVADDSSQPKVDCLFSRRKGGNHWDRSSTVGRGLLDALTMLFFLTDPKATLVLIEEVENHLHPDMQKRLVNCLPDILADRRQVIFSTHSPILADDRRVDQVHLCEAQKRNIVVRNSATRALVHEAIGWSVLDEVTADALVLVEGVTDKIFFERLLEYVSPGCPALVRYLPVNGDMMEHLDPQMFAKKGNVVAIIDLDTHSDKVRTGFANRCNEAGVKCHRLERYGIENFFPIDAFRKAFPKISFDFGSDSVVPPKTPIDEWLRRVTSGNLGKDHLGREAMSRLVDATSKTDFEGSQLWEIASDIARRISREDDVESAQDAGRESRQ